MAPNDSYVVTGPYGNTEIVIFLINAGADVNVQDKYGMSALSWADYGGYTEIIELLLSAGADESGLTYDPPEQGGA